MRIASSTWRMSAGSTCFSVRNLLLQASRMGGVMPSLALLPSGSSSPRSGTTITYTNVPGTFRQILPQACTMLPQCPAEWCSERAPIRCPHQDVSSNSMASSTQMRLNFENPQLSLLGTLPLAPLKYKATNSLGRTCLVS